MGRGGGSGAAGQNIREQGNREENRNTEERQATKEDMMENSRSVKQNKTKGVKTKDQGSKDIRKRRLCGSSTFSERNKLMYHPGFELIRRNDFKRTVCLEIFDFRFFPYIIYSPRAL